jgi:3-deoxy-manno-octulosonate cytidylyltransferase (CMP-KDO synthetase)
VSAGRDSIVVIPARMASVRLPGKPLADIAGVPMIVQVWRRATEAAIGPVVVGAAEQVIVDAVRAAGGEAVLTDPDLPSGSDRIARVLEIIDPARRFATVVNLQGDLPTMDPAAIRACLGPLADPAVDIATLAAASDDPDERENPHVVKALVDFEAGSRTARARDFVRLLPEGWVGPHYHHIGIYAYRRTALETFVFLPPGPRELARRLEQLRALDAGMRIDVALVDTVPHGVDTPADLERARVLLASRSR